MIMKKILKQKIKISTKELTLSKLQKAEFKQAILYLFCNLVSSMLISAYSALMFSHTILNVLPEGGDSRKQMSAIFVLSLFGCVVFTVYAASLFFRKKSRQLGILMALGASRKHLIPGVLKEVLSLSCVSSLTGILMGFPFVWMIWGLFRLFLVNSKEMELSFDLKCLSVSFLFFLLIVISSCITAIRYLKKTNIMDVIHEEHKNEPVRELGKWCGLIGILLLLVGAIAGYYSGSVYKYLFSTYPPVWLNITYAPVFIGLYMIMLHTVVHGWKKQKNSYQTMISKSMMKFQGKQTVNNLLVSTVLIAGSSFASFYIPMMGTGQLMEIKNRSYDYMFHWRADQEMPEYSQIEQIASQYNLNLKDWKECDYILLGLDGYGEVEENNNFHIEYFPLLQQGKFISESSFCQISKKMIQVQPGTYYMISNDSESLSLFGVNHATRLTNMSSRQELATEFAGFLYDDMLLDQIVYYVLNDADYEAISSGLTDKWKGSIAFFNVDGKDSYLFANNLFHTIVNSFGTECEFGIYYDPIEKIVADEKGEVYWGDTIMGKGISYSNPDASDFRLYWAYMPKFRILDLNDMIRTFAVYLMMFLFISIVCMMAALIISYTRCQTIALNNRYVFDDLKCLGASHNFLTKELKYQCKIVFWIPSVVGMSSMYFLFWLVMYGNDRKIVKSEIGGLLVCLIVLVLFSGLIFLVYKKTVRMVKMQLNI